MTKMVNQIFCETHQCPISITGCMLRQQRNQENPPAWMYNKIPGDPKCSDCVQGKAVMKKYKNKKEALMEATTESRHQRMKAELDELEAAAQKKKSAQGDGSQAEPAGRTVERKACNHCDLVIDLELAEKHFYSSKTTKDGFEVICKKCKNERAKERRHAKKPAGKRGRPKKVKQKADPKKTAAASPEKAVEALVTSDQDHDQETVAGVCPGPISEKTDTIKKNDHDVDLHEMDQAIEKMIAAMAGSNQLDRLIKHLFAGTYPPGLYDSLVQSAYLDTRPIHMQLVFLAKCQLEERGLV